MFGDDGRYNATEIGTITFHRDSGSPLRLIDVLFITRINNNIFSIALLEDHGYDVIVRKGKVFLRHMVTGQVKNINVQVKNLYSLEVEYSCKPLKRKAKGRDLVVEMENELPLNMKI